MALNFNWMIRLTTTSTQTGTLSFMGIDIEFNSLFCFNFLRSGFTENSHFDSKLALNCGGMS